MIKKICVMVLGATMFFSGAIYAQERDNLIMNPELKFDNGGQLANWSGSVKPVSDTGRKGTNSAARLTLEGTEAGKATMTQTVYNLRSGKYIFSAYIKLDRKINNIVLIRIIKLEGKDDYQGTHLKTSGQPEPGTWAKVMAEFDIPEGINYAVIAFDLRDYSPGATVWVDSPVLTYKPE